MKRLIPLLLLTACWPLLAQAALPDPIPIAQPTYAVIPLANIQLNYQAPYLWVRFRLLMGDGSQVAYCYKVNPTNPPAPTNGWVSALQFWSTGAWLPVTTTMTAADQTWCWQ